MKPNDYFFQLFMQYHYAETKDMIKHFLTLIAGILVFSLTFSEKVVNFNQASLFPKRLLFVSWGLLILAIAFCGVGMCFNSLAAGEAVRALQIKNLKMNIVQVENAYLFHKTNTDYFSHWTYIALIVSGSLFVLALLILVIAAIPNGLFKQVTQVKEEPTWQKDL